MYCEFFGFTEKPFHITPNPRFLFLSKNHREVFAHLLYGIRSHCGFIEVTGEVGTGKTTVLRTLLGQLDQEAFRLALILNPSLSALELLRAVNREFGLPADELPSATLLQELNAFLLRENAAGRTVVLVIDEAQNLEPAVLEQIRLLSNLETETDKLIQIVLVGQPELGALLDQPNLRQLSQRITVRYHLRPLDFDDTRAYIAHRLEVAGGRGEGLFTPAALRRVYRWSRGFPRLINILCDRALLVAYSDDARTVTPRLVRTACRELRREARSPGRGRRLWPAVLAGAGLLVAGLLLGRLGPAPEGPVPAAPVAAAVPAAPAAAVAPEELQRLRGELASVGEAESAARALAPLLGLWGGEPLPAGFRPEGESALTAAARERGLLLTPFAGSLETLLRLDAPALLELALPGVGGRRYLALTGSAGERFTVAPALAGRDALSRAELRGLWTGRALLPWRNFQDLPYLGRPGAVGDEVAALQELLRAAGVYAGEATGRYDRATIAAVTRFQAQRGIVQDGRVGPQTLLLLYQSAGHFAPPRLGRPAGGGA